MKTVSHPRAMKPSWAMVCSFDAAAASLAIAAAVWALIGWREIPVGEISSSLLRLQIIYQVF